MVNVLIVYMVIAFTKVMLTSELETCLFSGKLAAKFDTIDVSVCFRRQNFPLNEHISWEAAT